MRNAFVKALTYAAEQDDKLVLLVGDLGYKIFDEFSQKFPNRFYNMGIAEANMIGVASGLALEGFNPFVYSIVPFVTARCFEQIRNDVIFNKLGVKIIGVGGGYSYGFNGPTHHSTEDVAIMRTLPNLDILCPGDPFETYDLTIRLAQSPAAGYLRLGRAGEPNVHSFQIDTKIGGSALVKQGKDITILSMGNMLKISVEVADNLKEKGITSDVLSVYSIKPVDTYAILNSVKDKRAIFCIEEHSIVGGLYSLIVDLLNSNHIHKPVYSFSIKDSLCDVVGDQSFLRDAVGLSADKIVGKIDTLVKLGEKT